jgi:tRNA pseudouridine38-40 synthase
MMIRMALGLEYEGTHYHGFQFQKNLLTIQGVLEQALGQVAAHPINITCAGRTDAGVHALGQVIHFDTEADRPESAWTLGVNSNLPPDICIRWAKKVNSSFHARFSALSRTYHYVIDNRPIKPALKRNLVTWVPQPLDEKSMLKAAGYLIGEHDFTAFRSSSCQSATPFRRIDEISIKREGYSLKVELKANAFLHHMVRNIMGVLVEIGMGKKEEQWCQAVLESRNRQLAGVKMSAMGLYLVGVEYPQGAVQSFDDY